MKSQSRILVIALHALALFATHFCLWCISYIHFVPSLKATSVEVALYYKHLFSFLLAQPG